jgi:hypothetical protein
MLVLLDELLRVLDERQLVAALLYAKHAVSASITSGQVRDHTVG